MDDLPVFIYARREFLDYVAPRELESL